MVNERPAVDIYLPPDLPISILEITTFLQNFLRRPRVAMIFILANFCAAEVARATVGALGAPSKDYLNTARIRISKQYAFAAQAEYQLTARFEFKKFREAHLRTGTGT